MCYTSRTERRSMLTKAQRAAQMRYQKRTKQYIFRVNPESEPDIYHKLESVQNRAGYIKALIRRDIDAKKQKLI